MAQLGYACINLTRGSKTRTLRLQTAQERGISYIHQLITANLQDILENLKWNLEHNIHVYRISSDIFPHITNPRLNNQVPAYSLSDQHKRLIAEIGQYALTHKMHISFHCSAYTHLGSANPVVVENSINDIKYIYGQFIQYSKFPCIIIIHPDGCGDFIDEATQRFISNYTRLPKTIKDNLCIENTEVVNLYNTRRIADALGIPIVYDYFHAEVNPNDKPAGAKEMKGIKQTWTARHGRLAAMGPRYTYLKIYKFHISNQCSIQRMPRAHGKFVKAIPDILNKRGYIIMVEAKRKELAVLQLMGYNKATI